MQAGKFNFPITFNETDVTCILSVVSTNFLMDILTFNQLIINNNWLLKKPIINKPSIINQLQYLRRNPTAKLAF